MQKRLSKCVRCERVFVRLQSPVCPTCQPDEDRDFDKIRDLLDRKPDLTPEQLLTETGVPLECIMRMLSEGRLQGVNVGPPPRCGRCNAPAISHSLRLCPKCHARLNRDCIEAIRSVQSTLRAKPRSSLHATHQTVEEKREAYVDRVAKLLRPSAAQSRGRGR